MGMEATVLREREIQLVEGVLGTGPTFEAPHPASAGSRPASSQGCGAGLREGAEDG